MTKNHKKGMQPYCMEDIQRMSVQEKTKEKRKISNT